MRPWYLDPALEQHLASREPPYRSRGEAQVGRLLDRYSIPFIHEQPTVIYDRGRRRIWRPDFTLPTCRDLIVEYAGMPDRPDYMDGVWYKQRAYARNHRTAMFLYPSDLKGPRWPARIISRINRRYRGSSRSYRG